MSHLNVPGRPREHIRQAARIEAPADRARVRRLGGDERGAQRLQPVECVVELFDDQPLEPWITGRALAPEVVQRAVAPDNGARQQHRAPRPAALLEHSGRDAELPGARGHAQPGHAGACNDHLGQREACFVLDVLDPHTLGAPEKDRVRVRRVDDVVDLDAELLSLRDMLLGRVDEYREVVQQRALRLARIALVQLDESAADLDARLLRWAGGRIAEAEPLVGPSRGGWVAREQRGVVEVVVDVGSPLDEPESKALVEVEIGLALARLLDREVLRQLRDRRPQVGYAEADVLERAALTRPFSLEERQLAPASVRADERELVGSLDHVHAEMSGDEVRNWVALGDPERDVVERPRPHRSRITMRR